LFRLNPASEVFNFRINRTVLTSTLGRQTVAYFASQVVNAGLGLAVTIILTRTLSTPDFGIVSFVLTYLVLTSVLFDFGLSSASMRLMAVTKDDGELKAGMAAACMPALRNGMIFSLFVILTCVILYLSISVFRVVDLPVETVYVLLAVALLAPSIVAQDFIVSILQGANRMYLLSLFIPLAKLFFLVFYVVILAAGMQAALPAALTTLAGTAVSCVIPVLVLRPGWSAWKSGRERVRKEIREYGRHVYAGRIVDGLTNGLDKILITLFHGVVAGGIYSVAFFMTIPVGMLSRALTGSAYKRFAEMDRIPASMLWFNAAWCVAGGAVLVVLCEMLVPVIFPAAYGSSLAVLPLLTLGAALSGLNQPFHTYLAARRHGRAIKIMSVTTSAVNIAANFALVPFYSMYGAGFALVLSYGLNILMNVHFYRAALRTEVHGNANTEIQ
jgi:O-antigen/teichoic acid export membrane protein